ncbi:hypothetical protein RRG08_056443 [Elysia crispata]|uniref:PiggyBac transposable element-derived protein domain-containing protein n=1 Tax=Elysia crispata TaxID=231223 RepID=A0AAE1CPG7_9GAST|nr:hypothetical protein RRG08_056443 [Elysia crispata]
MARNRFQKLMSHVHFVNNLEVSEKEKTDKLWRLQPWLDSLQNSLKKLPQEEHSSVDEVMVPPGGKSSVKQYMRNKPHKWGFKLWGRVEASGTLYEFDVLQRGRVKIGKANPTPCKNLLKISCPNSKSVLSSQLINPSKGDKTQPWEYTPCSKACVQKKKSLPQSFVWTALGTLA